MNVMTTTTTRTMVDSDRTGAAYRRVRRLAQVSGAILRAIRSRWNDFVDSGQLGPSAETVTDRHFGARI